MDIILPVLGGLGLFIYGMNLMGDGLEKAAGNRLRAIIEKLTTNRLMGLLVGIVVTMIIQSSSATTVMVVGFVNAGIMNLSQAVGIIMGANVGTTITGQLIALNLTDYAPVAVAVGVLIKLVAKKKTRLHQADIVLGFGVLFVGLDMMSSGLAPLADMPWFSELLLKLENPVLAMLAGFLMTTAVQSSSAAIGILQALASQNLIGLNLAFPILFGDNIGTTTTSLLSSIGASTAAKRAALLHFIFNLVGTLLFMTVLRLPVAHLVQIISPNNPMRQIANAHTLFNVINVLIQLPFAPLLVKIVENLIPEVPSERDQVAKFLDSRFLSTPSIAVNQVKKEVIHMAELAQANFSLTNEMVREGDQDLLEEIYEGEDKVNALNEEITAYIVKLSGQTLAPSEHERLNMFLYVIDDIERIGDHAEKIASLAENKPTLDGGWFSDDAGRDMTILFDKILEILDKTLVCFRDVNPDLAQEVLDLEGEVDVLQDTYTNRHMDRLHHGLCQVNSSVDYMEVLNSLERISDHCRNIAYNIDDIDKGKIEAITLENF